MLHGLPAGLNQQTNGPLLDFSICVIEALGLVEPGEGGLFVTAAVSCIGPTGVEMEALTAVSVALLTLYDMCKALEKGMTITDVRLESKAGGRAEWSREAGS